MGGHRSLCGGMLGAMRVATKQATVDREARAKAASALQRFLAGLITNMEFDDQYPERSADPAIHAIYTRAWRHYDDFREHKLGQTERVSEESVAVLRRCVWFLRTGLVYEWPSMTGRVLAMAARIPLVRNIVRRISAVEGDRDVWPFFRASDLRQAQRDG